MTPFGVFVQSVCPWMPKSAHGFHRHQSYTMLNSSIRGPEFEEPWAHHDFSYDSTLVIVVLQSYILWWVVSRCFISFNHNRLRISHVDVAHVLSRAQSTKSSWRAVWEAWRAWMVLATGDPEIRNFSWWFFSQKKDLKHMMLGIKNSTQPGYDMLWLT